MACFSRKADVEAKVKIFFHYLPVDNLFGFAYTSSMSTTLDILVELRRQLQANNLNYSDAAVLMFLHDGPKVSGDVAVGISEKTPMLTRVADRLEKRKLIKRIRSKKDRRVVILEMTYIGRAMLDRIAGGK